MLGSNDKLRGKPSERSIELLRQNLSAMGISVPIRESDEGYLKDIMAAADELQPFFNDVSLDIEYLNKCLADPNN